jgi:hypothetical protein
LPGNLRELLKLGYGPISDQKGYIWSQIRQPGQKGRGRHRPHGNPIEMLLECLGPRVQDPHIPKFPRSFPQEGGLFDD